MCRKKLLICSECFRWALDVFSIFSIIFGDSAVHLRFNPDTNFNLSHSESDSGGEITFTFNQQPGNNSYTEGDGSLVTLDFDVLNQSDIYFSANYNEAVYDICGGCDSPLYSQHYDYDVSFWRSFSQTFEWYGCTDLGANNYNEGAIFDNGSCEYDSQEPQEIGD